MLDLDRVNLPELAEALGDQDNFEHQWYLHPETGRLEFWSEMGDSTEDGDPEERGLLLVDPIPSHVFYNDMVDFAGVVPDREFANRLEAALQGRGAFRRFKDALYDGDEDLRKAWFAFRDNRACCHAVRWLLDQDLVTDDAAQAYLAAHPDPPIVGPDHPSAQLSFTVTDADTAIAMGSGDVPVLGTPRVIAWLEAATVAVMSGRVAEGETTVGTAVRIEHRLAVAVGRVVVVTAALRSENSRRPTFAVQATDEDDLVAIGEIERAVVLRSRLV